MSRNPYSLIHQIVYSPTHQLTKSFSRRLNHSATKTRLHIHCCQPTQSLGNSSMRSPNHSQTHHQTMSLLKQLKRLTHSLPNSPIDRSFINSRTESLTQINLNPQLTNLLDSTALYRQLTQAASLTNSWSKIQTHKLAGINSTYSSTTSSCLTH